MIKDIIYYSFGTLLFIPGIYAVSIATIGWLIYALVQIPYDFLIINIDKISKKYLAFMLKNPENYTFITHLFVTLIFIGPSIGWIHKIILCNDYKWYHLGLYHLVLYGPMNKFFATVSVLAHKEGHYHTTGLYICDTILLNKFCEYIIGIFFGIVPSIFSFSHRKIHHKYNGGRGDTIAIYDCDRSNIFHFIWYLTRFLLHSLNITNMVHVFYTNTDTENKIKTFLGSIYYYTIICVYFYINPILAITIIIMPLLITNFFFASFNWSWHGFLEDEKNIYVTNTTIVSGDNNFWGEDYHVQHHNNPIDKWQNNESNFYKALNNKLDIDGTIFYYVNAFSLWMFMMLFPILDFPLVSSSLGIKIKINMNSLKNYKTISTTKKYIEQRNLLNRRMKKQQPCPNDFKNWYYFF